jgi:hypothetical protein
MTADASSFREFIQRLRAGDPEAAAPLVRVRMSDPRARRFLDSVDICQSVWAAFFVRVTGGVKRTLDRVCRDLGIGVVS